MTRVVWDAATKRLFETGIDRGVLYPLSGPGVPWNGLTSVEEDRSGYAAEAMYFDGVKYIDYVSIADYAGTIKAWTYPDEFMAIEGLATLSNGVQFDNQPMQTFGLTYRTKIGNDVDSTDFAYRIHVVYNLTAIPENVSYETMSDEVSPIEFSWKVTARPPQSITGRRPTAHVIIDSRKVTAQLLSDIEDILYGTTTTQPRLPTISELSTIVSAGFTITITDNGDGTWTATGPDGLISFIDPTTFQITGVTAAFIDANTYTISST